LVLRVEANVAHIVADDLAVLVSSPVNVDLRAMLVYLSKEGSKNLSRYVLLSTPLWRYMAS
ncbi:unnamed protein product, partial [Didymodactylos carnosus]